MYHYHGTMDPIVTFESGKANAEWSESKGADVKKDFVEGFMHTVPVSNPENTDAANYMNP